MHNCAGRLFLLALISFSTLGAASIQFSVFCSDAAAASDARHCEGSGEKHTSATVEISPTGVSTEAFFTGGGTPLNFVTRASAAYEADYLLTIHGGVGMGRLAPCLSAHSVYDRTGSASAVAAFGAVTVSGGAGYSGDSDCGNANGILLAFDVPTLFHLRLESSASANSNMSGGRGLSSARFSGLLVKDLSGNRLVGGTFSLTEIPEPSTLLWTLAFAGVMVGWRRQVRTD